MKIAVLTNDYAPDARGGAGVIAEIQVRELQRLGHEVRAFVSAPALEGRSAMFRLAFHLKDLKKRSTLVDEIVSWKPDILLTHNLTGCGFGTPRAIKRAGIPWVHVLHDVQLIDPSGQIVGGNLSAILHAPWRLLWSRLRRAALGHPAVVVSPTDWLLSFHRRHGFFWSSKSEVIPNPMASPQSDGGPREPDILFVGRVDRDKGIDVLVGAWREMGENRPRLHVVGDGTRRFGLASAHDAGMTIYGPQAHGTVARMMREHAVVAVPSLVLENQPTVILEALAADCRVVASDVGGIPETLDGAGWIVPAGDVAAWSRALRDAIDNTGDAAARKQARETILASHRVDVAVGRLAFLLTSNL